MRHPTYRWTPGMYVRAARMGWFAVAPAKPPKAAPEPVDYAQLLATEADYIHHCRQPNQR